MLRLIYCLFASLICLSPQYANAQNIKVVTGVDSLALPYATIINHSNPSIKTSDKNGLAKIIAHTGDTISISYVGYKTAHFSFGSAEIEVIRLFQEQINLPPVIIRNCPNYKTLTYSNSKSSNEISSFNGVKNLFGGIIWSKANSLNSKIAIRLSPLHAYSTIQNFSFWVMKDTQAPDSTVLAPILISFYEVNEEYLPGNLISQSPIVYLPKKKGKQTVNLDSLHLDIPPNGMYISLQYIMTEEYEWKQNIHLKKKEEDAVYRDTVVTRYGGRFDGCCSKDFELASYNYLKNEWISWNKKAIPNDEVHNTLKCEALIKYCVDN